MRGRQPHEFLNSNYLFDLVNCFCEMIGTVSPVLLRNRRAHQLFKIGSGEGSHSATVEEQYQNQYYEALDIAITSITACFNQPGYAMYKNLESLLVHAANGQDCDNNLDHVTRALLSAQLQNLHRVIIMDPENSNKMADAINAENKSHL